MLHIEIMDDTNADGETTLMLSDDRYSWHRHYVI